MAQLHVQGHINSVASEVIPVVPDRSLPKLSPKDSLGDNFAKQHLRPSGIHHMKMKAKNLHEITN